MIAPVLAGEGRWTPMDTWDPGPPSILTTTVRPDPADPAITAYAAWIRTSTAEVALYPGYKGPGATNLARGPEMVPVAARPGLLATFNSGFYEADSAAGFYTHGTLYFPMVDGLATLVTYTTGKVDIVDWTGGPTPGADVVMARQNLPLIVDAGTPAASLNLSFRWGVTLGGVAAVWRTAVGIDAHGNLIYVAASSQTAPSLARILVELGAVRGMELDINPEWPIFVTYSGPSAAGPGLFVPNPNQIPDRFLYPSTKDFFAVYERTSAAAGPPW
jgi:Phosphodiester glycosidase